MRRWLAAPCVILAACAAEPRAHPPPPHPSTVIVQPQPAAPIAAPPAATARPAPQLQRVWLLLADDRSRWSRCAPSGIGAAASCTPLPELHGARVTQVDVNEYLVRDAPGPKTWLWNAVTGSKQEIAAPPGDIEFRLRDGTLVSFEYRPNYTRVLTSKGGPWTPVVTHDRLRASNARLLPDGKVLFTSSPAMGGPESPYFVDVLIGHPTFLYLTPSVGGKPHRLDTGPQFMHADLVDNGHFAVYFSPGNVDQAANTRAFAVEAIDTRSNAKKTLSEVKSPMLIQRHSGRAGLRSAPPSVAFPIGPWFLHGLDHDASGGAISYRLQNVVTGAAVDLDTATVGRLVEPVAAGLLPIGSQRRWSDHLVVAAQGPDGPELRVIAIPSLEPLLRVPGGDIRAADVIVP